MSEPTMKGPVFKNWQDVLAAVVSLGLFFTLMYVGYVHPEWMDAPRYQDGGS